MELNFIKMNGLGNDFIFFEDFSCQLEFSPEQIRYLCDRHFGIGADGVIVVRPSRQDSCIAYMHYINSDGTLAEMCGNGVRCFAKFLVDRGYVGTDLDYFSVETLAGPRIIHFEIDEAHKMTSATVDMGTPVLAPARIPVRAAADALSDQGEPYVKNLRLESPWGVFFFTCVSMGNPHAVCFIKDWDSFPDALFSDKDTKNLSTFDILTVGKFFESHAMFPEKTNVEFASVDDLGIAMRVYERGCAETLACGTGACATSVAATLTGRAPRENDVFLRGGCLHITWTQAGAVLMTGAATESFCGTVILP